MSRLVFHGNFMRCKQIGYTTGALLGGSLLFTYVPQAHGALIESIDYNQGVTLVSPPLTSGVPSEYLSGTTLPVMQTVSLTYDGEVSQSTYNFSDSGSVVTVDVASIFTLNSHYETVEENTGTLQKSYTSIEFESPVAFVISVDSSTNGANFTGGASGGITGVGGTGGAFNSSYSFSGILAANQAYLIDEGYSAGNPGTNTSASGSGYADIRLTFTAIPEPSSPMMIFGCATLLLKRPMRWTKAGSSNA